MEKQQLEIVAAAEYRWREAAEGVIWDKWDIQAEIYDAANVLLNQVVRSVVTVSDLRAGVAWASALDAEAVKLHGSDLESSDQRLERVARRIMHHSGRTALESVKSRRKLTTVCAQSIK